MDIALEGEDMVVGESAGLIVNVLLDATVLAPVESAKKPLNAQAP